MPDRHAELEQALRRVIAAGDALESQQAQAYLRCRDLAFELAGLLLRFQHERAHLTEQATRRARHD